MLTFSRTVHPWLRAFIGVALVAAIVQIPLSEGDPFTARPLERILSSVGVASVYACYLASRFFGANRAKAAQGVFLACGLFIIGLSGLRMVDRELAEYFVSAQIILHLSLSLLFLAINAGLSVLMAMNFLRVRSGRQKGLLEIISGLAITLMMLSEMFPWPHEIHAPVCAVLAAICQVAAKDA